MSVGPALRRLSTGVAGLDEILHGGVIANRSVLVRGLAGTGKTTLAAHFLAAGIGLGEPGLFISLGETESSVRHNAAAVGLDLGGVSVLDLSPTPEVFAASKSYDIFSPSDVESVPAARKIVERIDELKPVRIVLDATMQFRYLTPDSLHFRRQLLSFLYFVIERGATVLITSEPSRSHPDDDMRSLCDGTIHLAFRSDVRTVRVSKLRGSGFLSGRHTMRITHEGMRVYPHLLPPEHPSDFAEGLLKFGVDELDTMLGGGIERGTSTLLTGPRGTGKTTLGLTFMKEAAARGERSVVYSFEESVQLMALRCEALNIPVRDMIDKGTLAMVQADPMRQTADEFGDMIRREVEDRGTRIVMFDSLTGYRLAPRTRSFPRELYSLCKFLTARGVTVLLVSEMSEIAGDFALDEKNIAFLADKIIFLRYIERRTDAGVVELRKGLGILKKRVTDFDKTLRELEITTQGIRIGKPMSRLNGILSRMPVVTVEEPTRHSNGHLAAP